MRFCSFTVAATLVVAVLGGCDAPAPAVPEAVAPTQTEVVTTVPDAVTGPSVAPGEQVVTAAAPPPAKDLKIIPFTAGSDALSDEAIQQLAKFARYMAKFRKSVVISGHTRRMGDPAEASALGDRRALAVRRFLIMHDVASDRIEAVSLGDSKLVDAGSSEEAQAKNDRIELELVEKPADPT
jgi:peptidoglycan-associated lipoprotein